MKTTVRNIMMSLVLVGGMILSVPGMAQPSSNRHRGSERPQVSRSSDRSSVSRSSDRSSVSRSSERPQVSRSSDRSAVSRSESRPQVTRSSSDIRSSQGSVRSRANETSRQSVATPMRPEPRKAETPSVQTRTAVDRNRGGSVTTDRGGNDHGNRGGNVTPSTRGGDNTRGTVGTVRTGRERPSNLMKDKDDNRVTSPTTRLEENGNRGNGNHNGNMGNDRGGRGNGNHNGNMGNDRGGRGNDRGGRGSDRNGRHDNDRGHDGGNHHGYGPSDRGGHSRPYNYNDHPHRDHFSWSHSHHNWSRPLPPPPRPYRPAPLRYYRPVIPAHYRPYYGAPVIDRILGLMFGTYYDMSLDYLYTNGYYIDGYQDNIIYLRDVRMLNLLWPDVMLSYDGGRLANAQFVYATTYRDHARYNRLYHDLSAVYGPPISVESGMATWFGGNTTGYVTLSMGTDYGRYYTTLSIGY